MNDQALKPINRQRAYVLAAEAIRERIMDGTWGPGHRIPAERELAEQLDISRGSTREALRLLEAMGWLEIRPGEGTIVREQTRVPLFGGTLEQTFVQGARLGEIWETRKIIEPQAAFMAADRASPGALRDLETAVVALEKIGEEERWNDEAAANAAFHVAIARASENGVMLHMQQILSEAGLRAARSLRPVLPIERFHQINREHRAIFDAIRTGKPEEAQRAAFDHLVSSWMAEWQ